MANERLNYTSNTITYIYKKIRVSNGKYKT